MKSNAMLILARLIFWPVLIGSISISQANGAEKPIFWEAAGIVQNPSNFINLRGPDKQTVATVSVQRVRTVVEVKQKIEQQSGVVAKLLLQNGTEPNAASGPNSTGEYVVVVNLAMMDLIGDDKDAYATVLGHEFAHLTLGHSKIRKEREGVRSGLSSILGAVLGLAGVPFGGTIANLGTTVVSRVYSRDEERDADNTGLKYAADAGFDPMAAPKLWEKMAAKGNGAIPFLSTHPAATERVDNMKQLALSLSKQNPMPTIAIVTPAPQVTSVSDETVAVEQALNSIIDKNNALSAIQSPLPPCTGRGSTWTNCVGEMTFGYQDVYVGEFRDGNPNGRGIWSAANGEKYVGNFKGAYRDGQGILYDSNGSIVRSGTWAKGTLVTEHPIDSVVVTAGSPLPKQ